MNNENLLEKPLNDFFEKVTNLMGALLLANTCFSNYSKENYENLKKFEKRNKKTIDYVHLSRLCVTDLSGENDNGWEINYLLEPVYMVPLDEYKEIIGNLLKRESAFTIAQGYEFFETFLKDIIAYTFHTIPEAWENYIKKNIKKNMGNDLNGWKDKIRKNKIFGDIKREKNNKHLFECLRGISSKISDAESKNNKSLCLEDWYEVYSEVRHAVTHSGSEIEKSIIEKWPPERKSILEKYFPCKETDNSFKLNIEVDGANRILTLLCEYAFLIFKNISIVYNLNWEIFKNMKKNNNSRKTIVFSPTKNTVEKRELSKTPSETREVISLSHMNVELIDS